MCQDNSRCIQLQGSPNDNPGINASSVYGAPEEPLKGYEAVLAVHEHAAEVLIFLLGNLQLAEVLHIRGLGKGLGGP